MNVIPSRTVLVVEDEQAIRRGIADVLAYAGYAVREAADGRQGIDMAFETGVDLLLLDLLLPEKDGFQVLEQVHRYRPGLPVIILTARGSEEDRVRGLKGGADDYVVKPFSAKELLARVEAVLRRAPDRPRPLTKLAIAECVIHLQRREAHLPDGQRRDLTEREVEILSYLAANIGRPISREELLSRVWGIDTRYLETRNVDMHIARLREKLGDCAEKPQILLTVRGKGYMIGSEVQA